MRLTIADTPTTVTITADDKQPRTFHPNGRIEALDLSSRVTAELTTARTYINDVVQARNQAGDAKVKSFELAPTNAADGYGCDWHPSLKTHQIMADTLVATLRTELGW